MHLVLNSHSSRDFKQPSVQVLERLHEGAAVALVSDAGMPAVSDPGAGLVAAAAAAGLRVIPVPGPSAALAALVASGLPTAEFHFAGFLPPKAHARRRRLAELAGALSDFQMNTSNGFGGLCWFWGHQRH